MIFIVAKNKKPLGVFTQRGLILEAIEKASTKPLFVMDAKGNDVELTYPRFNSALRRDGVKVCIYDEPDEFGEHEELFAVWQCEKNELIEGA